jgi:hypothetical protein
MQVDEPEWFELQREDDVNGFKRSLEDYKKKKGEPLIVVIVLRNSGLYGMFKNACYSFNVVSQVVQARVIKKKNLSVAGNILR